MIETGIGKHEIHTSFQPRCDTQWLGDPFAHPKLQELRQKVEVIEQSLDVRDRKLTTFVDEWLQKMAVLDRRIGTQDEKIYSHWSTQIEQFRSENTRWLEQHVEEWNKKIYALEHKVDEREPRLDSLERVSGELTAKMDEREWLFQRLVESLESRNQSERLNHRKHLEELEASSAGLHELAHTYWDYDDRYKSSNPPSIPSTTENSVEHIVRRGNIRVEYHHGQVHRIALHHPLAFKPRTL